MPGRSVIQWDKDDLDALGLIKVDILALGMLSALRRALELVAFKQGMVAPPPLPPLLPLPPPPGAQPAACALPAFLLCCLLVPVHASFPSLPPHFLYVPPP